MRMKCPRPPTATVMGTGRLAWPVRRRDQSCSVPVCMRWVRNRFMQFHAAGTIVPMPNPQGLLRRVNRRIAT